MPTRTQIVAATPRCPGKQTALGWKECGRALVWKHEHGWWVCRRHGHVDEPEVEPVKAQA